MTAVSTVAYAVITYQTAYDGPNSVIPGSIYDPNLFTYDDPDAHLRHEFELFERRSDGTRVPVEARGVRLRVPRGVAIDEFEVFENLPRIASEPGYRVANVSTGAHQGSAPPTDRLILGPKAVSYSTQLLEGVNMSNEHIDFLSESYNHYPLIT